MNTAESYINKLNTKFNYKFDYSKFNYITVDTPTTIICPIHGEFTSTPYNHYSSKYGCKRCGELAAAASKQSNTEEFIAKAKSVHGDKYNYTKTEYTSAKNKVIITCPHHGDFEQLASGHLSGYGCKYCASHGKGRVNMDSKCYLYYLKLNDLGYYKLGITSQSIDNRYRTKFDKEQFSIIFVKEFDTGREAYNTEQFYINTYASLIYVGPKLLNSGNTEIFTEDIFKGNYNDLQSP